tara:strand:- start:18610 stop:19887 length:1278 start_codon:yes stop_codon:yes gene_type:complete
MKKTIFSIVSIAILMVGLNCLHFKAVAQTPPTGNAEKQAILANKNFPFLSSLLSYEPLNRLVSENDEFNRILIKKREVIQSTLNNSQSRSIIPIESIVSSFEWQNEEISLVIEQIRKISSEAEVDAIFQEMKNNRQFSFQEPKSGADWIDQTLERELNGMNRIIRIYALAENPNSPQIDSVSYHVNSSYYQKVINVVALNLSDDVDAMNYFFEPTMNFALWLLEINKRDEAARFEPMELGENAKAVQQINLTDWGNYLYSAILIPGHGPEEKGVELSPLGMMRCKLAANRYRQGLAPFIILSGGYVHPFQTPFCEAIEMKKELMGRYLIPESALIIEPHARHTTTNFRNAARLMFKYGIPTDKKALCTTTVDQSIYITDMDFDQRCIKVLGYMPYRLGDRLNRNDIEFYPLKTSLFVDNTDPLDP